jgi:CheY-like chemotaxis protein
MVDDRPDLRELLMWMLERAGYEPMGAADGQEALTFIAQAAQDGRAPAVILLDLEMPGMDGWTFLQHFRLQGLSPLPQVIVTTALGVQAVVRKPYRLGQIVALIVACCPGGNGTGG